MKAMKLGSLFDGSGGFPLAGSLCGIEPVWAAEVEPYPIAVTRSRFPNMKHLGSVTDIKGGGIEPVDIITFGSPCQDLSVAGKRAGLKHEANGDEETTRSGLFMEAVRIIKEMRKATNGEYPTFAVWENVPGAFSSNKGEDFRTVLEELIKLCKDCEHFDGSGGQHMEIKTNADRVRAMSDEELAAWAINEAPKIGFRYTSSETGLLKWLQQTAEEDD